MTFLPCDIPRELLGTKADPTKLTLPCSPDITPDIKARMKAELEENETAVTVIVEVDRSELARWACPVYIDIQMALNDTVLAEVEILDDMRPGCDRFQAPQGIDMHFGRLGGGPGFQLDGVLRLRELQPKAQIPRPPGATGQALDRVDPVVCETVE